jgi:opacity protein-like surface antigen
MKYKNEVEEIPRRIMPTPDSSLKTLVMSALLAAGGTVFAQSGDQWYGGQGTGFWGVGESVGVHGDGALPRMFNPPGASLDTLNAQRQYGGYRISDAFAIEGAQTKLGPSVSACGGDPLSGDSYRSCAGTTWSLSGVATLPFQSGLSLYGRLGLNYRQKGIQDEVAGHRNADDPGNIGTVYGVGLSYGLTKSITVHAESERYFEQIGINASSLSPGLGLDSSVHSIGLSIKF